MKIGAVRLSEASIALLAIQLAVVCTIAGKYLYQRWTCPRVWTRTAAYDPELAMRGRYLSVRLMVDGCQSTLPSAKQARFPRDVNGLPQGFTYSIDERRFVEFPAELAVKNNKLVAVQIREGEDLRSSQTVVAQAGTSCDQMRLDQRVNFYIAENAQNPLAHAPGAELWIEVTVPTKGAPRPIQLALKEDGAWHPLAFQ